MGIRNYLVAACFLTLLAGHAQAAQITSVSYTVTGGTFSGPNLSGTITGGSFTYNAPSPYLSTGTVCRGLGACGSIVSLVLTGPAGTWSLLAPLQAEIASAFPTAFLGGFTRGFYKSNIQAANFRSGGATLLGSNISTAFARLSYSGSAAAIRYSGTSPGMDHVFTIGNEVRTLVPEPGTATLLGLGLLGLAASGRASARARRRRRA